MTVIKQILVQQGISQRQFGIKIGLDPAQMSLIITRKRVAWPHERKKIVQGLNMEESELFNEDGFAKLADKE